MDAFFQFNEKRYDPTSRKLSDCMKKFMKIIILKLKTNTISIQIGMNGTNFDFPYDKTKPHTKIDETNLRQMNISR